MNRRVDFFWFGAGALLATYGANEVLAWKAAHVRVWLGGGFSPAGGVAATIAGLFVIATLGLPRKLAPEDRAAIDAEIAASAPATPPAQDDDLEAP